ncbi:MAG: hypothetical protein HKN59_09720 [Gammaproteobacteria bacterium]|nr:hypothetical protein [Gammaproteobacteria bacterium]
MSSIFTELKRRNVFRVAVAYVVIGWVLAQVLDLLVEAFEAPGWVLKIFIALMVIGFLPALAFSWVYELTPEGFKRESEVDRTRSVTGNTARKLDVVTIAAVVIGAAFVGWTHFSAQESVHHNEEAGFTQTATDGLPDERSVAVLPFVNMSANQDNQYFADGLTETLLHMLAQVRELKVAARTSSFAFKDQTISIGEIARALNVSHVLEGSVQRSGERVRITAQLIRASDGFHMWSENYDRMLDDVFRIQDEIATDVRAALSSSLLGGDGSAKIESVATNDLEAYDLYLQALAAQTRGSYGALQEAERLLKKALAKDADFLEARTELALVLWHQSSTGLIPRDQAIEQGQALTAQVLQRRPQDVRARSIQILMASFRKFFGGDIEGGLKEIERLELLTQQAPSEPLPREFLVKIYNRNERADQALLQIKVLLEIDPLNPAHYNELGIAKMQLRAWDEARASYRRSLELEPGQPNTYIYLARVDMQVGDIVGFVRNHEAAMVLDPEDHELPAELAEIFYRYGLIEIGDRYKTMTDALAPTSPVARKLELERAMASGEFELAEKLARNMLQDNVEDRQGAWTRAARRFFRLAGRKGEYADALKFMETLYPGFTDPATQDLPFNVMFARNAALGLTKVTLPPDEFQAFVASQLEFMTETLGFVFGKDPFFQAEIHAARGEREAAIDVLLQEVFSQPETKFHFVPAVFWQPHLAPLISDPRIQAGISDYEQQASANRNKLLEYMLASKTDAQDR